MPGLGGTRASAIWGPLGLLLGFLAGAAVFYNGIADQSWVSFVAQIGTLWTNALRVAVIPLAVSLVVSGIESIPAGSSFKRWTTYTVSVFAGLLLVSVVVGLIGSFLYLQEFPPARLPFLGSSPSVSADTGGGDWASALIPSNLFESVVKGDMLPVVIIALLLGLALRQVEAERRVSVARFFEGLRDALLVYVRWVVAFLPLGAFCLAFTFAAKAGFEVASSMFQFVVLAHVLLALFLATLYVIAITVGRTRFSEFAWRLWPAQEVAIGTRSSLACLPTLVEGARDLKLPPLAYDLVLPLGAALLKVNRPITAISKLLFVAALFGVSLEPSRVVSFILTVLVLSLASAGVPSSGTSVTFGAYLAAGLPAEGVMLFEASGSLIDIGRTVANVTGNFTAATLVSRFAKEEPA